MPGTVTQATVSRDLDQMGAVKVKRGGSLSYALPDQLGGNDWAAARLQRILREWVLSIEAAGMVSLGKTNTPELGLPCFTEPDIAPPARTPWDLTRSAGGSSGGAAAAVAAGLLPFAQGSDEAKARLKDFLEKRGKKVLRG